MKKLICIIAPFVLTIVGMAQSRNCLRIMPFDELVRTSTWIGRVKVLKVSKANLRGQFYQLAILQPVEVIEGDSSLQQINVLAKSNVPCANDVYVMGQELLVFLVSEAGLYRTQNFQYGMFVINEEIIRGWHGKDNLIADKPYLEIRSEIETFLNSWRNPNQPPPVNPAIVPNSQTPQSNQNPQSQTKPPTPQPSPIKPPEPTPTKPPTF
ncbi:MAG: hypothetical protein AB1757_23600 [Acidobacteriota bacterium]